MHFLKSPRTAGLLAAAAMALVPASAQALSGGTSPGGTTPTGTTTAPVPATTQTVAGAKAKLVDGIAVPPASAPQEVKDAIAAANAISDMPYVYGGGHQSFKDTGYDCSGAVSFALHGGHLLRAPLDSSALSSWGEPGKGTWISVYGNPGHAYVVIAGLRFDTSMTPGNGPGWSRTMRTEGGTYRVRHPEGL